MTASVQPLRKEIGGADSLREALATKQQEAKEARQRADNLRAAVERARGVVRRLEQAVTAADKSITKAREEHAAAIASAATSDTAPPASGVRAARQAKADLEDELEAAKAALTKLKADLPAWEEVARKADIETEAAVNAVLVPHVQAVLEMVMNLHRQLVPLRLVLASLCELPPTQWAEQPAWEKAQAPLQQVRAAIESFVTQEGKIVEPTGETVWQRARALLRENPHAALPDFAAPPSR